MSKPSLKHPSRLDVAIALHDIEMAEARRAARAAIEAQRQSVHVTGKGLLTFFGWVLFYGLVISGLIWWGNL